MQSASRVSFYEFTWILFRIRKKFLKAIKGGDREIQKAIPKANNNFYLSLPIFIKTANQFLKTNTDS